MFSNFEMLFWYVLLIVKKGLLRAIKLQNIEFETITLSIKALIVPFYSNQLFDPLRLFSVISLHNVTIGFGFVHRLSAQQTINLFNIGSWFVMTWKAWQINEVTVWTFQVWNLIYNKDNVSCLLSADKDIKLW